MRTFSIIASLFLLISCSSDMKVITVQEKNTWIMQYPGEEDLVLPIYCMANEHDSGAAPVCYKAKLEKGVKPAAVPVKEDRFEVIKHEDGSPNTAVELDNR